MARCATCGALLGPDAEWCGQCYALVGSPRPEGPDSAAAPAGLAQSLPVSTNGDSAGTQPSPARPPAAATPALAAAAAMAAIPPDLQITLASGSSSNVTSLGDRGKAWVTALIVLVAASSDALFFPYARYMLVYGLFVSVLSGLAIWRLWARRSVKH
jgi:hypothetical protein